MRADPILCSLPGCTKPAVLQWQRLGRPDEAGGRTLLTVESARFTDELTRAKMRAGIASLQALREHMDPSQHDNLDRQTAHEQRALDEHPDTVVPEDDGIVNVAVFGCEDHAVDPDTATGLHEAHCLSKHACGCHADMPEPAPLVDA